MSAPNKNPAHEMQAISAASICDAEGARWRKAALKHLPHHNSVHARRDIARAEICEDLARKIRATLESPPTAGQLDMPPSWVLVPYWPAPKTPDYAECARQADVATGLPSLYRNPWLNIFIREINRWCQHKQFSLGIEAAKREKP